MLGSEVPMPSVIVLPSAIPLMNRQRDAIHSALGWLFLFQGVGPLLLAVGSIVLIAAAPVLGFTSPAMIKEVSQTVSSNNQPLGEVFAFGVALALFRLARPLGPQFLTLAAVFLGMTLAGVLHHWLPLSFQQLLAIKLASRAILAGGLLVLGVSVHRWRLPAIRIPALSAMFLGMMATLGELASAWYRTPGILLAGTLALAQVVLTCVVLFRLWRIMPERLISFGNSTTLEVS